jgi:glycosyltransferase involved in cell wall biosynthesis
MSTSVAVIRGAYLSELAMQTFEPLAEDFDITLFCLRGNNLSLKGIRLPIEKLWGLDAFVPRFLRRYYNFAVGHVFEVSQPMLGLNRRLKGFDVVHASDVCYYYTYQTAKYKKKCGYKLVLTSAENVPFLFGKNPLARKRIERIIESVDVFLPLTQRAAEVFTLMGVRPERIQVIPFGVDTTRFYPSQEARTFYREKFGISREDLVVLYVGRLSKYKGLFELVYAAKKIIEDQDLKDQRIKFVLVGDGPIRDKINALLRHLKIDESFRIVGEIDYSEIPKIHNIADIFVLPSIVSPRGQEQFGMVLIESMACGKPVISTLCGSIPEVVEDAGLLVQSGDHYSLYRAFKRLILDENLRIKLGELGRKRVMENFDSKLVAEKIKGVYRALSS